MEPLVLLPAMMCDARMFSHQINALSCEVAVTVAPVSGAERIEEIASMLLDQLPHRFALAGFGFGGVVAIEILRRAPDRLSRLCLMGCSPTADTPRDVAARDLQVVRATAGRLDEVLAELYPPELLAPGPGRVVVRNQVREMAHDLGPTVFTRQSRALQRVRDQQATLARTKLPVLVLGGAHDSQAAQQRQRFLAELIPNAELHVLERCGHLPTLEDPEATTALLRDWLR